MEHSGRTRRPAPMHRGHWLTRRLVTPALLALLVVACGGAAASPSAGSGSPPSPSAGAGSPPSPSAGAGQVDSAEAAVDAVRAFTPLFDGLKPQDPNLIGQGSYWTAAPFGSNQPPDGWTVTFTAGWGDCPAGCIDSHTWTWVVERAGSANFQGETGSELTPDIIAGLHAAATVTGVGGQVTAGPTCPVERPGDPACAPRMVGGAVLVVTSGSGEVARFTTDGSGLFRIGLKPGTYTITPQPVEGLMGQAAPVDVTVMDGAETWVDVAFDTGIR